MQLFEERLSSVFTIGPATIVKVEQRRDPVRSMFRTSGVEWEEYGVVIYTAKQRAVPVHNEGGYVFPEGTVETRFIRVPDRAGSCEIPENAGRVLGHYREHGQRWWVFLEKPSPERAASRPAPAERPKSAVQSPNGKAAPSGQQAPRASQPSSPQQGKPGNTAAPGRP